jgi:heme-degrading monooxygenase HmoA
VTTLDDRRTSPSPAPASPDSDPGVSGPATTRLRVVLLLDVLDGKEQDFLKAYEQMRHQVHAVPGHISDQLCQSLGNSSQWLITSEWESSDPFLEWVDSAEHRKMVEPMHPCVRDTTSLRFVIARETPDPAEAASRRAGRAAAPSSGLDPLPKPPLCAGGVVRHAITFTVKPGSEQAVAKLLADYESPQAQVDDTTRLLRTSLYMHGNRVVRAVEVEGDLGNALRHVAQQPEVRAVEEAINPYLEEDRDLTDPSSARSFFARAALPAVRHVASGRQPEAAERLTRLAYVHAVGPAEGPAEARRLGELDAADCADPKRPVAAATVFQRGEVLVRVLDVRTSADAAELARGGRSLDLVTDRTAPGA